MSTTKEVVALYDWIKSYGLKHVNKNGVEIILEALGKQIPAKPIHLPNEDVKKLYCPICQKRLRLYKGCESCLQAIDWEAE